MNDPIADVTNFPQFPQAPVSVLETPMNLVAQTIVTSLWVAMCLFLLVMLVMDYRKHRSWVPTFMMIGCGLGLFYEPFWDHSFQLVHYIPGQWVVWTAFGVPQPLWISACYISGFAAFPLVIFRKITNGDPVASFLPWIIVTLVAYEVVEILMTGFGMYEYWGAHPFRIWKFPAYVAFGNASGVFLAALGSAVIEMYERNPFTRAVGAILMFPLGFTAATYTTQMPILAVMSRQTEVTGLTYFAGLLSMTLGCCLIWLFLRCLPLRPGRG